MADEPRPGSMDRRGSPTSTKVASWPATMHEGDRPKPPTPSQAEPGISQRVTWKRLKKGFARGRHRP